MKNFIIIAGQEFQINANVILWNEENGMKFDKNIIKHDMTIEEVRKSINSFCIHHSVTFSAKQTFDVLNSRNLSVNFIIDDDNEECATIYQCMDLIHSGQSQKHYNDLMRGVEVSYMPNAWENPKLYEQKQIKHEIVEDVVHGVKRKVFAPSAGQMKAIAELCKTICSTLDILPIFPKNENDEYIKTVLAEPNKWTGLCCHYHLDNEKMDASGLDHGYIEQLCKS